MTKLTRRNALVATLVAGAAAGAARAVSASTPAPSASPAFAGNHAIKPLGFDPAKLEGLSEKLIRSHWENNYQGSVKALNMIEGRLAVGMADPALPPVVYGGLKREELHRTGSVVLHELYFEQFGGNGLAGPGIKAVLAAGFDSFEAWEAEFRRTAMALAGGSGWAVLAYNLHTRSLHNYWQWDHTNGAANSVPLLVLDMYEHAFAIDYGSAAAKYVDAFMRNLAWTVVEARFAAVAR